MRFLRPSLGEKGRGRSDCLFCFCCLFKYYAVIFWGSMSFTPSWSVQGFGVFSFPIGGGGRVRLGLNGKNHSEHLDISPSMCPLHRLVLVCAYSGSNTGKHVDLWDTSWGGNTVLHLGLAHLSVQVPGHCWAGNS